MQKSGGKSDALPRGDALSLVSNSRGRFWRGTPRARGMGKFEHGSGLARPGTNLLPAAPVSLQTLPQDEAGP